MLSVQEFAPQGTDLSISLSFEERDVVLTISKAGFAIYRLTLEDIQDDLSISDLATLARSPVKEAFSPDMHLRILRRVQREHGST